MEDRLDHIEDAKTDWKKMLSEFYGPVQGDPRPGGDQHRGDEGHPRRGDRYHLRKVRPEDGEKAGQVRFFPRLPRASRNAVIPSPFRWASARGARAGTSSSGRRKKGRGGTFYACTNYPTCEFFTRDNPAEKACPRCGRLLFKKIIKGKGEKLICLKESCGYQVELLDETMQANGNGDGNGQNNNGSEQQEA